MDYEAALSYVNEKIELAVGSLKKGQWVVLGECGIIPALGETIFSFPTKKQAIFDYGCRCMDARRVPKVERRREGFYDYYIKDCDDGHDRSPVSIVKLSDKNIHEYQTMLREDLETIRDEELISIYESPFYTDDSSRGEAVRSFTSCEIYEFPHKESQ